jgi:hypothetical protein
MTHREYVFRGFDFWFDVGRPLLFLLVITGLLILGLYVYRRRGFVDTDPLRRAAARYAAGKIERVEFERIRSDLIEAGSRRPLVDAGVAGESRQNDQAPG